MPRNGALSSLASGLRTSVFAHLAERMANYKGEVYPLHIGDTFAPAPKPVLFPGQMHKPEDFRYGHPTGLAELLTALAAKLALQNGLTFATPARLQVAMGATQALLAACRAVIDPGEEVLVCTPRWPLIDGIIRLCGGIPVEVSLYQELYADPSADPGALLAPHVSEKTVGIYVTTPNNPDGKVLSATQLASLAAFAAKHDLWIFSDEVYEDILFDCGRPASHVSIASLPGMSERTFSVFSFSKSWAMAGLRLGYVLGPEKVMGLVRRIANHTVYNVPTTVQRLALSALEQAPEFPKTLCAAYCELAEIATKHVDARFFRPEGASYLFLDLRDCLPEGETSALGVLDKCLDVGVLLAPGEAFGRNYAAYARLCFTAVPRERLEKAIAALNGVLDACRRELRSNTERKPGAALAASASGNRSGKSGS